MKRDTDFIRKMLFEFEEYDRPYMMFSSQLSPTPEQMKRNYHVELMADAGLVRQAERGSYRLTNQGHDFLETIRNDTRWGRVKKAATEVGAASLPIFMSIAAEIARSEIEKHLGIGGQKA